MGINKARQYDTSAAIDFVNLLSIAGDPGIAQRFAHFIYENNLPGDAQNRGVLDDPQFIQITATPRTLFSGWRTQGEQLADVGQKKSARPLVLVC